MIWRKAAHIALGITLLMAFQLYGVAELIRNEPPRGSVFGLVYSERTLAPIPNAFVRLEREQPLQEPMPPEGGEAPLEMPTREQGWDVIPPEGTIYPYEYLAWETYTDAQGRFQLRGIPAGVYRVYLRSKVHHWSYEHQQSVRIEVREGERVEVDLPMTPPDPFLELVHPQAVYYPDEPLRVGIRGFHYEDTMRLTLYRVRSDGASLPPLALHNFLSDLRYGWWHPSRGELRRQLERFRSSMQVVWEDDAPVRGRDPEGVYIQYVNLPRQPEGTYVLTIEAGDLIQAALICLSSVGVVSKSGQGIVEVWCTDLRTGQPIPNAEVRIFGRHSTGDAKHEPTAVREMAAGRTDAQGLWRVQIGSLAGEEWRKPMLAVRSPRSGALVHWGRLHIGSYGYGEGAEPLVGTLYPERPIYRPGDTIHIKGIARLGNPPDYRLPPPGTPVTISITNPREERVYETHTTTTSMGSFHFDFRTSPEAETGFYYVRARVGDYGTLSASIPLSAYRKPTYRIQVKPSDTLYMPGETVRAEIRTEYYFGMPVPNTRLVYTLYRREKFRWEESLYSAVDYVDAETDVYDEFGGEGNYGLVVATGELNTDAAGRAVLRLPADQLLPQPDAEDTPDWTGDSLSYAYTLEVFALSEGWEGAKGSAEFEIAPSVWEARLVPQVEFGEARQVYRYRVRLTDRRTGQPVRAQLRWEAGRYLMAGKRARYDVRAEGTLETDAQGNAQFEFAPETSGDWHIKLTGRDSAGNRFVVSHWLWVWDDGYVPWWAEGEAQRNALEVRLQKRHYEPGEQAELALRTPYPDAVFYITLEGNTLYHSQIVRARGSLTRVRIPLTREQIPNAYVSVCMVRNKELIQRVLEVKVGGRQGMLQVSLQTDKSRYQPGETLTARLLTTDLQGRPVPAEVSLAVVDEALYSIREDNPQSVYRAFYGQLPNGVITDFSAVWLALQGDKGAVETVRRDFPDTAFWQPAIMTDARGQATVRLRLPDNLTEWRLTAIAHSRDTRIGFTRTQVKAAKDLMARLRLPLWLIEGDRTEISAIVSNDTAQPRTVQVELRAPDGVRTQTVSVPAGNSTAVHWAYEAKTVGTHKFTLVARELNGQLRDAEERVIEIHPRSVYEVDTRTLLLDREHTLTLTLRPDAQRERTTLTVETIPSIGALITQSLNYLIDYPYGCVEQTVSRFVPAVIAQRVLEEMGTPIDSQTRSKLAAVLEQSIQRLQRLQTDDGGWGWWEAEESTLWITAYVVWGLHKARQAGVAVPAPMYERGLNALRQMVYRLLTHTPHQQRNDPSTERMGTLTLFTLWALAQIDPNPPDALRDRSHYFYEWVQEALAEPPAQNTQHQRLMLIHIFQRWRTLPDAEQHLDDLWRAAQRDAYEDRSLIDWSPQRTDVPWWYWSDWMPTEVQALALQALVREGASSRIGSPRRHAQLLRKTAVGLLMGYRGGAWYSSRDTALAVEALLDYLPHASKSLLESEAEYEVWCNGQRVRTLKLSLDDRRRPALSLRDLPWRAGENTLTLRPLRGAPLVCLVLQQAYPLDPRRAENPTGPLHLRVYRVERPEQMTLPGERLRPLPPDATVRAGDLLRIDVQARMPQQLPRLDYTVLETPFPAGCAPFDTEAFLHMWWWQYDFEQIRDDRAISFRRQWTRGDTYYYSLLVRAETPGEYTLLPARLWGMYAPYQAQSNGFRLRIVAR